MTFLQRIETRTIEISEKPWFSYVLLALITLFAAALRFYKLGEWSFWIDEIYTVNHAMAHFSTPALILENIPPNRNWIPLSVIFGAQMLNVLGIGEWSARLASAIIGVVSVPILYFPVRKIFGVGTALIFSLLLALSPWHLFWAQNARFYSSLILLYALAAFIFYFALEQNRPWYFVPFYILLYFALSERLIAGFLLPVLLSYAVSIVIFRFERPRGLTTRNLILLLIPVILAIAYESIQYSLNGSSNASFFIEDFGNKQVEDPFRLLISIIYNVGFPVFGLGLLAGIYLLLKRDRLGLFLVIAALLPVLSLMVMNQFMFTKDRYAFMTLTFWLLLSAIGIWELLKQSKGVGIVLALGLLVVLMADAAGRNIQYYLVDHGNRRDWRAAFQIIKDDGQPEDVVVAWWPQFSPFYLGREILPTREVTPESVLQTGKRSWFLIDSETVWGNIALKNFLEENAQLIEVLYLRLPEDDFNIRIYLYDPASNMPSP